MNGDKARQHKADLALLGVAFIWGITFVVVKDALADIGPYYFLAFRFTAAFIFLCALYYRQLLKVTGKEIQAGVFIGLFLFGGYAFQTVGLKYTGAASAGFITGLSVVLVPLFVTVYSRRLPSSYLAAGVSSAVTGLALLSLNQSFTLNYGDLLVFFCAVCFAGHILMVGRFASRLNPVTLTIIQIGTVSAISFLAAFLLETPPGAITRPVWTALLITSIPATSLAFLIQNKVQKFTSTTHTAIIFTMEPVFAGLGAYVLAGEMLTARQLAGCAMILAGMIIAELKGAAPQPPKQELGIGN
ncbi:MAG: DMT family transporter [Bacillota bacterium]